MRRIDSHADLTDVIHDFFAGGLSWDEVGELVREHRTERYEDHGPGELDALYDRIMVALDSCASLGDDEEVT